MIAYIHEENHDLPLCRLQWVLPVGASTDEPLHERPLGLCNFATELMRRGARGQSRAQIDAALDQMGASIHVSCSQDAVIFDLLVLKDNLFPACKLLADMILFPDFPEEEAAKLQRETLAGLDEMLDDDSTLAEVAFAQRLYRPHPYGRPIMGTASSILQLTVQKARAWHQAFVHHHPMLFGVAGDVSVPEVSHILDTYFSDIPRQAIEQPRTSLQHATPMVGPQLLVIDKPERTQSQILLGHLAPRWTHPHWLPLYVATTALGGTFTARLMEEVRVKRGLSYGASASLGIGKEMRSLSMHVFPSAAQTAETLDLVIQVYKDWVMNLSKEEIDFAKTYLAESHAFSIQTPEARLKRRMLFALCGKPQEDLLKFPEQVLTVSEKQIREVLAHHTFPAHLVIAVVATASDVLPSFQQNENLVSYPLQVLPYQQLFDT